MKKLYLILCLCFSMFLVWCNCNTKLQSAKNYCDEKWWILSQEWKMFVCTYPDGSVCESEDFAKWWCVDLQDTDNNDLSSKRAQLETEENRIQACQDKVMFLLNSANVVFEWWEESEWWASFYRKWKATYTKQDWTASEDVECMIDMVDASVNIEFSNHEFEWVVFYPEDDLDTLNAKRESYVNNSIALENDKCNTEVINKNDIPYWTYVCQQTTNEWWDYNRAWIYNIFDDERMLTCNEANWEQWVWFDQEKYWEYNKDKNCFELENYIAQQL